MEKLKNIVREVNMSTRPEYYAGYNAILSNLNGEQLQGIFEGVKKEYGEAAAENFVAMVAGMEQMKATSFLNELYSLYYAGWKYVSAEKDASNMEIAKDEDGNYDIVQGMAAVKTVVFGNDRDDTDAIRNDFLRRNGYRPIMGENTTRHMSADGYVRYEQIEGWEKIPTESTQE